MGPNHCSRLSCLQVTQRCPSWGHALLPQSPEVPSLPTGLEPRHFTGQSGPWRPRAGKPLTSGVGQQVTCKARPNTWAPQHTQPGQVPLHGDHTEGSRGRGGLFHHPHNRKLTNMANRKLPSGFQRPGAAAPTGSSSFPLGGVATQSWAVPSMEWEQLSL